MSFSGIFRSKNRRNRVIYDPEPVSPNDKDTFKCIADEPLEQTESCEACQEAELTVPAGNCEEPCLCPETCTGCEGQCTEEPDGREPCLEEVCQEETVAEEACQEEGTAVEDHCEQAVKIDV